MKQNEDVLFAYIFGSRAKEAAHPRSDVDVAVYCADVTPGPAGDVGAVERQISLSLVIEQTVGKPTDVVVLNRASLDLRQNVLTHGELLFSKDPAVLAQFKRTQLRQYQDFIMLEPILRRYRKKRIKEGTFGARSRDGAARGSDPRLSAVRPLPRCRTHRRDGDWGAAVAGSGYTAAP